MPPGPFDYGNYFSKNSYYHHSESPVLRNEDGNKDSTVFPVFTHFTIQMYICVGMCLLYEKQENYLDFT